MKKGDKVRITGLKSGHCFKIGEIVTITMVESNPKDTTYRGNDELGGLFGNEECEPVNIYTTLRYLFKSLINKQKTKQ